MKFHRSKILNLEKSNFQRLLVSTNENYANTLLALQKLENNTIKIKLLP